MNAKLDTETFLSASSVSVTLQDRTSKPVTWRKECVAVHSEQENVAARRMLRDTTVIDVNQICLDYQ